MPLRFFHILAVDLFVAALLMLVTPTWVHARAVNKPLSGQLEWSYADYRSDADNGEDFEASHFTQKYSLNYDMSGSVYNAKGGSYSAGIGAEWWSVDSTFGDQDINLSNFRPLYHGELRLHPGGLPFRLHLFAYDTATAGFISENFEPGLLESRTVTDVSNGEHRLIGGTLVAGIKNGSYAGEFRDYLSRFPKLYVDFRQVDTEDNESLTPQRYRDRNLAFVSLNKKDNWFHFKLHDFEDFIDSRNNFIEKTYLLGTIDHLDYRQWIWLTNWVRLSTDASFTTIEEGQASGYTEDYYNYNLFFTGKRNRLNFSNFNTMTRGRRNGALYQDLEVPLFLTYAIDPDRRAYLQLLLERSYDDITTNVRSENAAGQAYFAPSVSVEDAYMLAKLETGLTRRWRLDPALELEIKSASTGDGQGARARLDFFTNRSTGQSEVWFLSYSLTGVRGTPAQVDTGEVSFLEQVAEISYSYQVNPFMSIGAYQKLISGRGEDGKSLTDHITLESDADDSLRSITELSLDYRHGRLRNHLMASYDYQEVRGQNDGRTLEITHKLNYVNGRFSLNMNNEFQDVDNGNKYINYYSSKVGSASNLYSNARSFENDTIVKYQASRKWFMHGRLNYVWTDEGQNTTQLLSLSENASYNFFHVNGIKRAWLRFDQELQYELYQTDQLDQSWCNFTLGTYWYPTYNTWLHGRVGYEFYDPGQSIVTYGVGLGVDFPLFKIEARYEYGFSEDDDEADVKDHRWELNVKKII